MEFLYLHIAVACDRAFAPAGLPIDSRIWDFNGGSPALAAGFVLGQEASSFEGPASFALEGAAGFGEGVARAAL